MPLFMRRTHDIRLRDGAFRLDLSLTEDDPLSIFIAGCTMEMAEGGKALTEEETDKIRPHIRAFGSESDIRKKLESMGASEYVTRAEQVRASYLSGNMNLADAQKELRDIHTAYILERREGKMKCAG